MVSETVVLLFNRHVFLCNANLLFPKCVALVIYVNFSNFLFQGIISAILTKCSKEEGFIPINKNLW